MQARPDEMAWYDAQYARIDALNAARPGTVVFDGHGDDMARVVHAASGSRCR